MKRGVKANKRKNRSLRKRLALLHALSSGSGHWVLSPIHSEREEWSECVRGHKASSEDDNTAEHTIPDESVDEFDDLDSGF